jgi:hypothetical protein
MRLVLFALLAGCLPQDSAGGECSSDSDCSGSVCTRDEQCTPASDVRSVKITWTVSGMPAGEQSCTGMSDLFVQLEGDSAIDTIGWAPVPCAQGQFSIDKLPTRFGIAELGIEGGTGDRVPIDSANTAHFDLFP